MDTQSIGVSGWILANSELRQIDRTSLAGKHSSAQLVIDANALAVSNP